MRDRIIRIHWSYPGQIDNVIASPESTEKGVYYISRDFGGHETSLYLGKATRTFRERLKAHNENWLTSVRGTIYIRLGLIEYPIKPTDEQINDAESGILFSHKDIFPKNEKKIYSYSYKDVYRIENQGFRGKLPQFIRMQEHPDLI